MLQQWEASVFQLYGENKFYLSYLHQVQHYPMLMVWFLNCEDITYFSSKYLTASKVFVFGVILVCISPAFSRIRTDYRERRSVSPFSVRKRKNFGKNADQINSETDTFYAVFVMHGHVLRTCIVVHNIQSSLLRQTCKFLKYKCRGFTLRFLLHIYLYFTWKIHYYEIYYTNTIITVFRFVLENIARGLSTNRGDVVVGMTEVNIPGTN